jgi:hypothetical protein
MLHPSFQDRPDGITHSQKQEDKFETVILPSLLIVDLGPKDFRRQIYSSHFLDFSKMVHENRYAMLF